MVPAPKPKQPARGPYPSLYSWPPPLEADRESFLPQRPPVFAGQHCVIVDGRARETITFLYPSTE